MTVWWLAAVILATQVSGNHAQSYRYRPIGVPLETVCSNAPQTWTQLDNLCSKQFPGYRLLQRGYRERFGEVEALDLAGLIPLRVKRFSNVVYWVNDFGLDNEEVSDEYLMDMQDSGPSLQELYDEQFNMAKNYPFQRDTRSISQELVRATDDNALEGGDETVGALNLANMRWRLVNDKYQFSSSWQRHSRAPRAEVCAVCEMLPRRDIRSPVYGATNAREAGNIYRVTVRCLEPEHNQQVTQAKRASRFVDERLAMDALADFLDISKDDIELESSPLRNNGEQQSKDMNYLILLSPTSTEVLLHKRLLEDKFKVTGVDNLSACAAQNTSQPAIVWPETDAGNVVVRRNLENILTTRECVQTDNGGQWTKPVMWKLVTDDVGKAERRSAEKSEIDLSDMLHRLASFKMNNKLGDLNPSGTGNEHTNYGMRESKPRTLRETAEFIHSLAKIPVKSRYLDVVAEELNRILQLDRANISTLGSNPTRLAQDLERIVTNMVLESGHDTMCVVKSDVALLVANVDNTNNPLSGVSLSNNQMDASKMSLEEIRDENIEELKYSPDVEVSTVVPRSLISASKRVAFTIFSDDKLFQGNTSDPFVLQSRVINIAVDGNPNFPLADGEFVEISFKANNKSLTKRCVFWSFAAKAWSVEGCTLLSSNARDVCRCNHLTHFALLVAPHKRHSKHDHSAILHKVSIVCCCFSLIGLISITMTLMVFKNWHQELDTLIVMNISTAMAFNIIIYLVTAFLSPKYIHCHKTACVVLGALLHYSVLVCFCWMLVVASLQVLRLFTSRGAGGISHLFCKVFIFAWGIPLIPVIILLVRDVNAYKYQSDRQFCYPHGKAFYETVLGPVAVIIILNAIAFVLVVSNVFSCCCWRDAYKPKYVIEEVGATRRFKTTIFLFFLFGLPWSFGFFAHKSKAFAYIFCFTATLQGFVLFAFIVIIEGHTRVLWRKKMFGR